MAERRADTKHTAKCSLCGTRFSFYLRNYDVIVDQNNHRYRLCPECTSVIRDQHEYTVEENPHQYLSEHHRWVQLFVAIQQQAQLDHKLEDWESYWLYGQEMKPVWLLYLTRY